MQAKRYLWFFISVIVGMLSGLIYGWFINPPSPKDMYMVSLRSDYKTDYILMVAEIFNTEKDIALAKSRLLPLDDGEGDLVEMIQRMYIVATELNFTDRDKELMVNLSKGLESGVVNRNEPVNE